MADCPICKVDSVHMQLFTRGAIKSALLNDVSVKFSDDAIVCDYDLFKCPQCTLQHAWPLVPAEAPFYDTLALKEWYFPKLRWEWDIVIHEMVKKEHFSLLEVGCGSGAFLKRLPAGILGIGMDLTPSVVAECQKQGLQVYEGALEKFREKYGKRIGLVDCAVAFHCLEHVADPVSFVKSMSELISPQGSIFVSTPYSPMCYEHLWPDPLNAPPHHMTRWNRQSYENLAERLGLGVRFYSPRAPSLLSRSVRSFSLLGRGPMALRSRSQTLFKMALSPIQFISEIRHQKSRDRINGQIASDVVLVEFQSARRRADLDRVDG